MGSAAHRFLPLYDAPVCCLPPGPKVLRGPVTRPTLLSADSQLAEKPPAATAARAYQDRRTGAMLGLVMLSHWVLDWWRTHPTFPRCSTGRAGWAWGPSTPPKGTIH